MNQKQFDKILLVPQTNILPSDLSLYTCACSVAKLCPTLCDPMDCSPPGSSVRGISQARILEWVAISFCIVFSQPKDPTLISCVSCTCSLPLSPQVSPLIPLRHVNCSQGKGKGRKFINDLVSFACSNGIWESLENGFLEGWIM